MASYIPIGTAPHHMIPQDPVKVRVKAHDKHRFIVRGRGACGL